jgi:hypothetical protein
MKLSQARELYDYGVIQQIYASRDDYEGGWNLVFVTDQDVHHMRNTHGTVKTFKTFDALCRDAEKITSESVIRAPLVFGGDAHDFLG